MRMENNLIEEYLGDWYNLLDNNKGTRSLMILPNPKIIKLADLEGTFNYSATTKVIGTYCGDRLYIRSCDEINHDGVVRLAGFSFERIYIIDTGVLSNEVLAVLRSRLRSPLGIDCKMYINGKA